MRQEALDLLRRIGGAEDDAIDLAGAALSLALLDHPVPDLAPYRAHLAQMCADLAAIVATEGVDELTERIAAIRRVLVDQHGYAGDSETYEDLQNANLIRVIDRKRGLPVALGILMIHLARSQGWEICGLSFPGHFLIRMDLDGQRLILDPFEGGSICEPHTLRELLKQTAGLEAELSPEHYAPVSNREVLLRLQNNLKLRHLSTDQPTKALAAVEVMLLFAPDHIGLWRESGLLNAHAGKLTAAIAAFEHFMELARQRGASQALMQQTATLLQQLRSRLN
jgi:regulator of sirC expression with transglutaminase-like and TPR domain